MSRIYAGGGHANMTLHRIKRTYDFIAEHNKVTLKEIRIHLRTTHQKTTAICTLLEYMGVVNSIKIKDGNYITLVNHELRTQD